MQGCTDEKIQWEGKIKQQIQATDRQTKLCCSTMNARIWIRIWIWNRKETPEMWKTDRTSGKSGEMMEYNVKTELSLTIERTYQASRKHTCRRSTYRHIPSRQGSGMPDQARFLSTERIKDIRLSQASPKLGDETTEKSLRTLFRGNRNMGKDVWLQHLIPRQAVVRASSKKTFSKIVLFTCQLNKKPHNEIQPLHKGLKIKKYEKSRCGKMNGFEN